MPANTSHHRRPRLPGACRRIAAAAVLAAAVALGGAVACNSSAAPRKPDPPTRTGGGWVIGTIKSIKVVDSNAVTLVNLLATDGKIDPGNQDRWVASAFEGALEDTNVVVRVIMPGTSHPEIHLGEKIKADCSEVNEFLMAGAVFFHDCIVTDLGTS